MTTPPNLGYLPCNQRITLARATSRPLAVTPALADSSVIVSAEVEYAANMRSVASSSKSKRVLSGGGVVDDEVIVE